MSISHDTPIGWGILGTGNVARRFAADFSYLNDARLVGVGSRRQETARLFGKRFEIHHQYGSYQELVDDPGVEAVYIATPASVHKNNIMLCLAAGKAVLCEKPLTVTGHEAEEVIALARLKQVFLMEAMWTRFLPIIRKLRDLLAQGRIGKIHHFMADLGSPAPFDPQSRIFNAELGGGAMLQRGIYLLSLANMIFGSPSSVKSFSMKGESGVDEETGFLLKYGCHSLATLWCSISIAGQREGAIVGTNGLLRIHPPINCPSCLTVQDFRPQKTSRTLKRSDGTPTLKNRLIQYAKGKRFLHLLRERFPVFSNRILHGIHTTIFYDPPKGEGLHYQVSEVNRCLRAGRMESPIMPWDESLSIMRTMDQIRAQS
ncbi:MAG: Gfo/Idh/MocA family protein [Nitrospirales bacterium]|nr:Gfo/Idh/MocA family oxidoreductase [Nitrospirales bacterium]